jgi:hypothetical protein
LKKYRTAKGNNHHFKERKKKVLIKSIFKSKAHSIGKINKKFLVVLTTKDYS